MAWMRILQRSSLGHFWVSVSMAMTIASCLCLTWFLSFHWRIDTCGVEVVNNLGANVCEPPTIFSEKEKKVYFHKLESLQRVFLFLNWSQKSLYSSKSLEKDFFIKVKLLLLDQSLDIKTFESLTSSLLFSKNQEVQNSPNFISSLLIYRVFFPERLQTISLSDQSGYERALDFISIHMKPKVVKHLINEQLNPEKFFKNSHREKFPTIFPQNSFAYAIEQITALPRENFEEVVNLVRKELEVNLSLPLQIHLHFQQKGEIQEFFSQKNRHLWLSSEIFESNEYEQKIAKLIGDPTNLEWVIEKMDSHQEKQFIKWVQTNLFFKRIFMKSLPSSLRSLNVQIRTDRAFQQLSFSVPEQTFLMKKEVLSKTITKKNLYLLNANLEKVEKTEVPRSVYEIIRKSLLLTYQNGFSQEIEMSKSHLELVGNVQGLKSLKFLPLNPI